MTADEVINQRKLWDRFNYRSYLPEATVLATSDWLKYVQAMSDELPRDMRQVTYPSEEEVAWGWPEGVTMVLDQPWPVTHTIISVDESYTIDGNLDGYPFRKKPKMKDVPAHPEAQKLQGLIFGIKQPIPTRMIGDETTGGTVEVIPVLWIGEDPTDIITGHWLPGGLTIVSPDADSVSESTCFMLSVINALGHRLTTLGEPVYIGRGERRRVQRAIPSLRVLRLSSGASTRPQEAAGGREWSKRWIVRGHWHTIVHGPRRSLRRLQWMDPYVKGPEDKPLDTRRTIWKT